MNDLAGPPAHRPPDRTTAWACLLSNLLVLPGLGSLAAGRKIGIAQMALAVGGFGLTVGGVLWIYRQALAATEAPDLLSRPLCLGAVGIGLFLSGWLWALFTSLTVLRESVQAPPKM
jgi:hypothetical protein